MNAWVVSVLMGLGHMRAAYPLRDLSGGEVLVYGSRRTTPPGEYRFWKKMRRIYYFSSRAGKVPFIGQAILGLMLALQKINPYYPKKDQSKATAVVRYLRGLIVRKGLCRHLRQRVEVEPRPVVHTFYATAIALDLTGGAEWIDYLLVCDADFNRVWVPEHPQRSRIRYLAPCTQAVKRLLAYGVPEEQIFLTGFPLPKENIGSRAGLEILKADLFARLLRLDPQRKFFSCHERSVLYWLNRDHVPPPTPGPFHLTFAIGGAGAQSEMVHTIMGSLADALRRNRIVLHLSVGIQAAVFERVMADINRLGLHDLLDERIFLVFDTDVTRYLDKFNRTLRQTDVLWTKPSELSFYCGLGIPILLAPPIGTHEELNKRWLQEIHAGIKPPGPPAHCHEWLFDLRDNGRLAEAAWDGFLKARKLGTYKIEQLVGGGGFFPGDSPLEQ